MKHEWFLDGEKVQFTQIIRAARNCGYESTDGIYRTSEAVPHLKRAGHDVEYKEEAPDGSKEG